MRASNGLWGSTLILAAECLKAGAPFSIEHPAEPANPYSPALWRIPIVKLMHNHPRVQRIRVKQGYYGASSPKPTDLMLIHCAQNAEELIKKYRSVHVLPPPLPPGKDASGRYYTAALKEYPASFSRGLVAILRASLLNRNMVPEEERHEPFDATPALERLMAGLEQAERTDDYGLDFNHEGFNRRAFHI